MTKNASSSLKRIWQKGGEIPLAKTSAEELEQLAGEYGLAFFSINCDKARNCSAVLRAIAKAVDYPVFFGTQMDSLHNCVSETLMDQKHGMVFFVKRLHAPDPDLQETSKQIIEVFNDVLSTAQQEKLVFVFCIDYAGEHDVAEPGEKPVPYGGGD